MSDDEDYEYEYDDDDGNDAMDHDGTGQGDDQDKSSNGNDDDEDGDNQFEYTDEEEEQDDAEVALENAYYNAKGLREADLAAAAAAFEQVITQEQEEMRQNNTSSGKVYGPWSFKAMKQLVKLNLRAGNAQEMMKHYHRLLECVATGDVSPNAVEKGTNAMLERVASLYQGSSNSSRSDTHASLIGTVPALDPQSIALAVYDATLTVFHPVTGACKNERLWFKTTVKYGQLLYELNETAKLQQVLKELIAIHGSPTDDTAGGGGAGTGGTSSGSSVSSTQSMEIYALQIQLYSRLRDHKKLREIFTKAMAVRGGIPHPRTLAMIQELGGKMHMASREYESAGKTFFQAFKSYDEAGDPSRLRCLKYLVLASMLHASTINPFDSQEARPYRDDPEIVAMTNLVQAFHNNEIQTFEKILRQNQGRMMEDEFVREHIEDLLRTIRTQVLRRVVRPYQRISLEALARELNDIPVRDVEALLIEIILNGQLDGRIDRVSGVLLKQVERGPMSTSMAGSTSLTTTAGAGSILSTSSSSSSSSGAIMSVSSNVGVATLSSSSSSGRSDLVLQCEAMEQMITSLEELSNQVTSMRGMIH